MKPISFKRHRFPPDVIRYAVWLYFRFTLSVRDVEELLAERGIEASREAVRCWVIKFGPLIAANLRRRRLSPTGRWHLDEMVVRIGGKRMYLWRAVDALQKARRMAAILLKCAVAAEPLPYPQRGSFLDVNIFPKLGRFAGYLFDSNTSSVRQLHPRSKKTVLFFLHGLIECDFQLRQCKCGPRT